VPNFKNIQDVEQFAEMTQSSLLYAYLETFGKQLHPSSPVYQAASHLGRSLGLTILLRGTRHHIESRLCYFPQEWIQKASRDCIVLVSSMIVVVFCSSTMSIYLDIIEANGTNPTAFTCCKQ